MTTAAYIAYEPEDAETAGAVIAALQAEGLGIVQPLAELRRPEAAAQLAGAVAEARCLVLVVSSVAARSENMRREAAFALANGRPIISVLAEAPPPDTWLSHAIDPQNVFEATNGLAPPQRAGLISAVRASTAGGRVIAMLNIKGGVGKTILSANLFAAAHLIDNRSVVFVDIDPQHNLTQYFIPPEERHQLRNQNRTLYAVLQSRPPHAISREQFNALPVALNRGRIGQSKAAFDMVAGDERLFEYTLDMRSAQDRSEALVRFQALISQLRNRYQAVVIDVNPCATFLTRCAISAADHIVAPVRPEKYSLTGLNMLEHVVREIRCRSLRPDEFSVLLNGVGDRTRARVLGDVDAMTRSEIQAAPFFGSALLPHAIPYSGALRATPADRYAPNPINVTALMRERQRDVKDSLTAAAADILRRAGLP
jgi:chromosome partitioning protein